jgi:two-component system sensor histidine kinase UhpB
MVKIRLQTIEEGRGGEGGDEPLRAAIDSVDRSIRQVREMSFALRPAILDDLGIAAALRSYADRHLRAAGIAAHLSIATHEERLPRAVETACFRIAEEAMVNVVRHSGARNVWVDLARRGPTVALTIRDDGRGFDSGAALRGNQGAHRGLSSMTERAAIAGGSLEVCSSLGAGAEVRVTFPAAADLVRPEGLDGAL